MAGLYKKKNLGEKDLNLKDAIQKLYKPGIEEDLKLFAFSNSLFSKIRSASLISGGGAGGTNLTIPNEIYGLINEPFTDEQGNIIKRTKFVTNKLTFSSNNETYFERISDSGFILDKRSAESDTILANVNGNVLTILDGPSLEVDSFVSGAGISAGTTIQTKNSPTQYILNQAQSAPLSNATLTITFTYGIPLVISKNGSIVEIEISGEGSQYKIFDPTGAEISTSTPTIVEVYIRGLESGAENAIVSLTVLNGQISKLYKPKIINGGSGYLEDEKLEPVTQCRVNRFGQQETPELSKCRNYPINQNRLYHLSYDSTNSGSLGYKASFSQKKYTYLTKDANDSGFFLYDRVLNKWVYLGETYDSLTPIPESTTPHLIINRFDRITALNILNLDSLDKESHFFSYAEGFRVTSNENGNFLDTTIRRLTQDVEDIKDSFKYLLQNSTRQRLVNDPDNKLGTSYNIFEGRNFDSTFRLVLRDPDGIVDKPEIEYVNLRTLELPDQVELYVSLLAKKFHIPGIYINAGGVYRRAFSTDDKPFSSTRLKFSISPILHKLETGPNGNYQNDNYIDVAETGENKYSISAAYLRPGGASVLGFDTEISILVQNLSSTASNGGFVFHRTLSTPTINSSSGIQGWPLFNYSHNNSTQFAPLILGYTA